MFPWMVEGQGIGVMPIIRKECHSWYFFCGWVDTWMACYFHGSCLKLASGDGSGEHLQKFSGVRQGEIDISIIHQSGAF